MVENIAKNIICDGYEKGLLSRVYNLFDKKSSGGDIKKENISDQ